MEDVKTIYIKLVRNFFSEKYFKSDEENFICRKDIEQSLFLAFILLGQDKMAHVFLRIVKVRFKFKLYIYIYLLDFWFQ